MHRIVRVVRILPLVILLGTALRSDGAFARMGDKSWEIGGYTAYTRFSNNSNVGGETGFGIRGAFAVRAQAIVELDYDSGNADHADTNTIKFDIKKIGVSYRHLFFLKGHDNVTPHFLIGLGSISIDDGENSLQSIFYRAGGGFSYNFTPALSLRFDVRIFRYHGDADVGARPPVPGPEFMGMPSKGMYAFDAVLGMSYAFRVKK